MLKLYHGSSSVCSAKVRIGLAEKNLQWESVPINLQKGEQFTPDYLSINPNGVVPTLIDDGFKIFESSIILEYIDSLSPLNPLMPSDLKQQATAKLWLLRCLDIHAAINTMTFSTVNRQQILAKNTPEEIAASIAKMPNPKAAAKKTDLIANGLDSVHVTNDFLILKNTFKSMHEALEKEPWISGEKYGIIDTAIIAYMDRLDRLALSGLWQNYDPHITDWFKRSRLRSSYEIAINKFTPEPEAAKMREIGEQIWPEVLKRWRAFIT